MGRTRKALDPSDARAVESGIVDLIQRLEPKAQARALERALAAVRAKHGLDPTPFEMTFREQIRTMRNRGVPKYLADRFAAQEEATLEKARRLDLEGERMPFIPVIPFRYVGLHGQVRMVKKDVKGVRYDLDPTLLRHTTEERPDPYYIFGVTDRPDRRGGYQLDIAEALGVAIHGDRSGRFWAGATRSEDGGRTVIVDPDLTFPAVIYLPEPNTDLDGIAMLWSTDG